VALARSAVLGLVAQHVFVDMNGDEMAIAGAKHRGVAREEGLAQQGERVGMACYSRTATRS
jgi:hypothetical protein